MHLELSIDSKNEPYLIIKLIEEPIHNFRVTMKQVFSTGRIKILDAENIQLEKLFGDDEHLYINKTGFGDVEQGGDFRFVCDVTLTPTDKTLSSKFSSTNFKNMARVANDQKFLDFTIKFRDGRELKVLKFILASKSPVFFKIFTSDMVESKTNEMYIPDVDYQVMKIVVNFMYNGSTEGLAYHIFDVIIVADKYQILELKKYCEIEVSKGLTTSITADVLIFADRYNAALLKARSIKFIHRYVQKIS